MKKSLAVLGVLSVAACGGGTSQAGTSTPQATQNPGSQQRQRFPGASGLLAAVSGTTLQVQSTSSQTAVTYTGATTFTDTVAARAGDLVVGACVLVRSSGTATGATPPTSVTATSITATSVTLTAPVNGSCTAGFAGGDGGRGGFGGGRRSSGAPAGGLPSGAPAGGRDGTRPSGAPRGGFGGGAFGKVTAVKASGFTVASTVPGTRTVAVTTTRATTYTKTQRATAAVLKVGTCVTARGTADSTGTVKATAISIRPATLGTCTGGFGGRGA